jgi:DNA-binding response OmpR family regulator
MSKILLVEDNNSIRELLHFLFTRDGFTVLDACDGKQGFSIAKAEKPDLIITDLEMPVVNGMEMVRQLRCEPDIADTPVLLFTGQGEMSPEAAWVFGVNKTFYKPRDYKNLVLAVRKMLPL